MKKVVGIMGFIIICIIVLIIGINMGMSLSINRTNNFRYGYFKVNYEGEVIKNIKYGDGQLENYDLYLPKDNSKNEYSLILYIHGGGFTGGDKGSIDAIRYGEYFANKGYVVASVNYTLRTNETNTSVKEMYDEVISSLNSIVKKSEEKGYYLTEMATTGGSAGGCLAMLVAYKNPSELILPIRLVFQEVGPASFEPELWEITDDIEKVNFVNTITGEKFNVSDMNSKEYQDAIDSLSVDKMINENSVPMILAYGLKDNVVNPKAKYPLLEALEKYNITHDYIEFPNSGHGLLGDKDKLDVYYSKIEEYLQTYMPVK